MYLRMIQLTFVVIAVIVLNISAQQMSAEMVQSVKALNDMSPDDANSLKAPPTEQDRLDTVIRALRKLPDAELQRLGIDLSQPIIAQTEAAQQLLAAWSKRQEELRDAMKGMLKPAEHIGKLVSTFTIAQTENNSVVTKEDKLHALAELESMLTDTDNSRDFHTIVGWPVIASLLRTEDDIEIKQAAALALGTAIKNDYDYQLWLLEDLKITVAKADSPIKVTCLDLLLDLLDSSLVEPIDGNKQQQQDTQKRALYAIAAGLRGNVEIQAAVLEKNRIVNDSFEQTPFVNTLLHIASSNSTTPEVARKVFALVSDMLEERAYVKGELMQQLQQNVFNLNAGEQATQQQRLDELNSLALLGNLFVTDEWLLITYLNMQRYYHRFEALPAEIELVDAVIVDATDAVEHTLNFLRDSKIRSEIIATRSVLSTLINVATLYYTTTPYQQQQQHNNALAELQKSIAVLNNRLLTSSRFADQQMLLHKAQQLSAILSIA